MEGMMSGGAGERTARGEACEGVRVRARARARARVRRTGERKKSE